MSLILKFQEKYDNESTNKNINLLQIKLIWLEFFSVSSTLINFTVCNLYSKDQKVKKVFCVEWKYIKF